VVPHTGEKLGNPRFFHRDATRLAKAQRRLAKKQFGSKNRAKARRKVARIHAALLTVAATACRNSRHA
jgi:putative transposase